MYKVFISYRRIDCSERATLIRTYLSEWFDEENIFLDTQEIHDGEFPTCIENALNTAQIFVLLISKNSFNISKQPAEKNDFYYEEIRRAIAKGIKIIPIVYDNINYNNIEFPKGMESLEFQNAIYSHTDDPNGLKNRLYEFTRKKQRTIKDWLALPLAIITVYLVVTLISFIGMYLYDHFSTSYEDAVEIASEHIIKNDDTFLYHIAENRYVFYNPRSKEINESTKNDESVSIALSEKTLYKIGIFTIADILLYKMVKSKYKPHSGKQYLAYIGIAVSIVAGVGLGCALEQMVFPQYRVKKIRDNIYNPEFWQDVIKCKYQKSNRHIYQ